MSSIDSTLLSELRNQVGDNLRAVAEYNEDGYEFLFIRDDVNERYTSEELDDVFDDLLLDTLRADFLEGQFHGGDYQCSALGFEEMLVFQFVREDFDGLLVSFDRDCAIDYNEFVRVCNAHT